MIKIKAIGSVIFIAIAIIIFAIVWEDVYDKEAKEIWENA